MMYFLFSIQQTKMRVSESFNNRMNVNLYSLVSEIILQCIQLYINVLMLTNEIIQYSVTYSCWIWSFIENYMYKFDFKHKKHPYFSVPIYPTWHLPNKKVWPCVCVPMRAFTVYYYLSYFILFKPLNSIGKHETPLL